ncbi:hypothetical protein VTN77DRAFT_306 [Rasamsonia byssochlamydoides]|uniref:uncharacterized protein n=1 Tax=Rasamsonia byssochlamydoides TaxID=89139 RepID=UPI003743E054
MNNRPVEQALATLLPTHADELPPELLSLAQSLVAQSRSYSTSLKPEEEIARPYACAEIACKRLSRALKLPPLVGHPPCPPRVYKKLYAFLEKSLASSTVSTKRSAPGSAPGTPTRPSSVTTTPTKGTAPIRTPSKTTLRNTPTKSTPLKRTALDWQNTSSSSSRKLSVKNALPNGLESTSIKDAPAWVMPSIRTVCKTLSTPAPRMGLWSRPPISRMLPPHIFAGVSSILHFISVVPYSALDKEALEFLDPLRSEEGEESEDYKELVYALIVAVYFIVLARRRTPNPASGAGTDGDAGAAAGDNPRKMDKKTFAEMRNTALSSLGLSPAEKRHGEDVDAWIALIMKQGWAKGQEWFENVPMAGENDGDDELSDHADDYDEDGGPVRSSTKRRRSSLLLRSGSPQEEGLLLPGLGTMMQDRVDWLSEERQEDYLEWKAEILKRIEEMEQRGGRPQTKGRREKVAG